MTPPIAKPGAARMFSATARGSSVVEALVAIGIFGILISTAISDVNSRRLNIVVAQSQVVAQLRLARIAAITSVSHYAVSFTSATQVNVYPMTYNGTTWQLAGTPKNTVTLPSPATFAATVVGSRIEFNSRGMVVSSSVVTQVNLTDVFGQTRSLQAWPSGQVYAL